MMSCPHETLYDLLRVAFQNCYTFFSNVICVLNISLFYYKCITLIQLLQWHKHKSHVWMKECLTSLLHSCIIIMHFYSKLFIHLTQHYHKWHNAYMLANVGVRITKVCKWRSRKKNWGSNFNIWWTSRLHLFTKWPLTLDQQFHFIHQYVHRVNHPTTPESLCKHKFLSIHHFHPLVLHFKAYIHCCDKFHPSNDFIHHYTYTLKHTSIVVIDFIWKKFHPWWLCTSIKWTSSCFSSNKNISSSHMIWWIDTILCCIWGSIHQWQKFITHLKKNVQMAHFCPPSIPWWALCF